METKLELKFNFSEQEMEEISKILSLYETKRAALLPLLNLAQEKYGLISPEIEETVAHILDLPLVKVREVVSFYTLYHAEKRGKYDFQVCHNMSCDLMGCEKIVHRLKEILGIEVGETSKDGRFSLATVECLGACEMAPMMRLNNDYIGCLNEDSLEQVFKKIK